MKRFKNKNKSAKANRKIEYFAFMLLTIVSGIRLWFAPKWYIRVFMIKELLRRCLPQTLLLPAILICTFGLNIQMMA